MTAAQLAEKSGLSVPTIYNIEAGRAENPRRRTIERLEKALGKKFEKEFEDEVRQASTIEGIGEFQDFDPHEGEDWPGEAGVYVFYDISERPIYVGMAGDISDRMKGHEDRFWFKRPIVERASCIAIKDKNLRRQIEMILIKFLKSNAIINKQGVERDRRCFPQANIRRKYSICFLFASMLICLSRFSTERRVQSLERCFKLTS